MNTWRTLPSTSSFPQSLSAIWDIPIHKFRLYKIQCLCHALSKFGWVWAMQIPSLKQQIRSLVQIPRPRGAAWTTGLAIRSSRPPRRLRGIQPPEISNSQLTTRHRLFQHPFGPAMLLYHRIVEVLRCSTQEAISPAGLKAFNLGILPAWELSVEILRWPSVSLPCSEMIWTSHYIFSTSNWRTQCVKLVPSCFCCISKYAELWDLRPGDLGIEKLCHLTGAD